MNKVLIGFKAIYFFRVIRWSVRPKSLPGLAFTTLGRTQLVRPFQLLQLLCFNIIISTTNRLSWWSSVRLYSVLSALADLLWLTSRIACQTLAFLFASLSTRCSSTASGDYLSRQATRSTLRQLNGNSGFEFFDLHTLRNFTNKFCQAVVGQFGLDGPVELASHFSHFLDSSESKWFNLICFCINLLISFLYIFYEFR